MRKTSLFSNLLGRATLGFAIVSMMLSHAAHAEYPDKPIKMIIGYAAGGAADKLIRPVADQAGKILGQQFIMEYRPGAGAAIALDLTAKAPPDGYTLHITDSGPMVILPHIRKLAYDPLKDFTNIAMVGGGGTMITVRPDSPAKNITDLIALAKKDPTSWSYGTSGVGGVGHLSGEQFAMAAGLKLTHVPYKGGAPAVVELLGGHVPFLFASLGSVATQIDAGQLKGLAVTSANRSGMFPNVPTLAESGFPGFDAAIWFSIVGPKGLPPEVMKKIVPAFAAALKEPRIIASIKSDGYDLITMTPEEMDVRVKLDYENWGKVIKAANIRDE